MGVDIEIMYKSIEDDNWSVLKLTPEQYFDPLGPEEKEYDVDSVPRFLEIKDYLKIDNDNITNINVFLKDRAKNTEVSYYYTYWNNGRNMLLEVKEKTSLESYEEIIIELAINQRVCEILKFCEKNGTMHLIMHVQILNNPDGSQSEFNYLKPACQTEI